MDKQEWSAAHYPAAQARSRWALAWVFWVDLLVILVLLMFVNIGVMTYVSGRALQQGVEVFDSNGRADLNQFMQLLGTTGFVAVMVSQCLIFSIVPVVRVAGHRRRPLAQIGFQAARPLPLLILGIGLGLLMIALNIIIGILFTSFGIEQNQMEHLPLFKGDLVGNIMIALGATVLAPIGEEILFRGYAFNAFMAEWGVPAAYLLSALLFSIAHSLAATQGLVALLVPTFLIGLVLAFAMHRTSSLLPCIIAHALNNAVAISFALACTTKAPFCQM